VIHERGGNSVPSLFTSGTAPFIRPRITKGASFTPTKPLVPMARACGAPVRKKHHTEILARMPDGRTVYVSLDRSDRLWEIEDAEHDRKRAVPRGLVELLRHF
jgi:hypothetical protein